MAPLPHYLRFARAAALVSVAAATPGCFAHERPEDLPDSAMADVGPGDAGAPDSGNRCLTCMCDFSGTNPDSCENRSFYECCAAVGPLAPPDLEASA